MIDDRGTGDWWLLSAVCWCVLFAGVYWVLETFAVDINFAQKSVKRLGLDICRVQGVAVWAVWSRYTCNCCMFIIRCVNQEH